MKKLVLMGLKKWMGKWNWMWRGGLWKWLKLQVMLCLWLIVSTVETPRGRKMLVVAATMTNDGGFRACRRVEFVVPSFMHLDGLKIIRRVWSAINIMIKWNVMLIYFPFLYVLFAKYIQKYWEKDIWVSFHVPASV